MRTELAIIAAMLPNSVEFQIHQVVPTFQINKLKKANPIKVLIFVVECATQSKGTNAKKMQKVKGDTGQEATSSKPLAILKTNS